MSNFLLENDTVYVLALVLVWVLHVDDFDECVEVDGVVE
jgi:hypothetical protein